MRKRFLKLLNLILSGSIILNSFSPVFASEYEVDSFDNSIESVEYQNSSDDTFTNNSFVFAKLASVYKVTIPKFLVLSGTEKKADYFVKVEGDIAGYEEVDVVPEESFSLYSIGKDSQTATISQDKTTWRVHNFNTDANGLIKADTITAGKWTGTFNFNISFKENGIEKEEKLSLNVEKDLAIGVNDTTEVKAFYNGKDVTNDVNWESDNDNIKVNNGIITTSALAKPGDTANITASLGNSQFASIIENFGIITANAADKNKIATFKVTIIDIAFSNEDNEPIEEIDIFPGNSTKLSAKLIPEIDDTILWSYTAPAGISLQKNKNEVIINVANDMPVNKTYHIIATYGDFSKIIKLFIKNPHTHIESEIIKENEVLPTCTTDGSYENVIYCTSCKEMLSKEKIIVPATGHVYDEGIINKENTCTEDGIKLFTCTLCGNTKTQAINKLGHIQGNIIKENEVLPTCTTDGSLDEVIYCTRCNAELSRSTKLLTKLEHDWQLSVKTNATCDTDSTEAYICMRCSETKITHDDKMTGHIKANKKIISPTCTEQGYTQYTCSNCKKIFVEDIKASLDHNYVNGTCTRCGNFDIEKLESGLYSINDGKYTKIYTWKELLDNKWYSVNSSGLLQIVGLNVNTNVNVAKAPIGKDTFLVVDKSVKQITESSLFDLDLGGIYIPETVTKITASRGNRRLNSIYISSKNNNYTVKDGVIFTKDMKTLVMAPKLVETSYTIPSGVQTIASNAFERSNYTSIIIPEGVTKLEKASLRWMEKVTEFHIPKTVSSLEGAFAGNPLNTRYILDSQNPYYTLNDGIIYSKDMKTIISCPAGRTTRLDIPSTVTVVADNACDGCKFIPAITMTNNITKIGWGAFRDCRLITSITLPKNITRLENCTFSGVPLNDILIPKGVNYIVTSALNNAKKVTFEDTSHMWKATLQSGANANSNIPTEPVYLSNPTTNGTYFRNSYYYNWQRIN